MQLPSNIDDVLAALDDIIDQSIEDNSYASVFAYVYRRTTAEIKTHLDAGSFEDRQRMHDMDVIFANLYIEAFHNYRKGQEVSKSWKVAFDQSKQPLALIQHLILGMNAHINLDLAVAASQVMHNKPIHDIASDFRKVNEILASITDEMQRRLGRVSPLLFLLDWIGKRSDEKLANFSITIAREFSWNTTVELWQKTENQRNSHIGHVDQVVAELAVQMARPESRLLRGALGFISRFESSDQQSIIVAMRG